MFHALSYCVRKFCFNITLAPTSFMESLSFTFPQYNPFVFSPICATCPAHAIFVYLITYYSGNLRRVFLQTPVQKHLVCYLCYLNYCSKNLKFTSVIVDDVVSTFIKLSRVSCLIVIVVYSHHHTHIESQD
jgi:hypothetical protein